MIKYFEVSDKDSINKINEALKPINNFDEKLHKLQKKYKADKPYVFNSIDRGLDFSYLYFEKYPMHLDTKKEFKISSEKYKTGWEVRPRKSNKKFYAEFMQGMENVDYKELQQVLFGEIPKGRLKIEYTYRDEKWYLASSHDIVLGYKELTGTEYQKITA